MARIVLGIGTSHTPMLNAPVADWTRFIERDRGRAHLDKAGNPVSYEELEVLAGPAMREQLDSGLLNQRHAEAMSQVDLLGEKLRSAKLDALIVVGDDQKELFQDNNMPSMLVYHGESIRNVPLANFSGPQWAANASAKYYEPSRPRDYPVDHRLARHIIGHLVESEFDIAIADSLPDGYGEGHAFGFVHNRLLNGTLIPAIPVFLNTYYPPNQPTPRRCYRLGQAIREAVESFPSDARVGVVASGGLSHFTVNEELDGKVIQALRDKDAQALERIPRELLNAGNSEIRNWICMAGAIEALPLLSLKYIPAYRTPAGTGTGLCFAVWE
ncbi:protocatechuate 3,4-dioxygenase [Variovorax saccharolyticus]|uniref:DODA-type extradiol aromatic ring-opening family dioxygenase n=1 Tax=Variovorax saccharolyticus TaxID=3053516 RepID=UPI00257496DF|nr:protocatechuate 3,4-dioxygenase [Variovorax sp. J22R187]MDM0021910.1 protocatechuate 3,4-dioxygenase [Variovorax sp. J22R187]